jgi:hypothetical protein
LLVLKWPRPPRFGRLALASQGGESKLLFHRRNKKVVAARTQIVPRAIISPPSASAL